MNPSQSSKASKRSKTYVSKGKKGINTSFLRDDLFVSVKKKIKESTNELKIVSKFSKLDIYNNLN